MRITYLRVPRTLPLARSRRLHFFVCANLICDSVTYLLTFVFSHSCEKLNWTDNISSVIKSPLRQKTKMFSEFKVHFKF